MCYFFEDKLNYLVIGRTDITPLIISCMPIANTIKPIIFDMAFNPALPK